jgi:hypothetical protein
LEAVERAQEHAKIINRAAQRHGVYARIEAYEARLKFDGSKYPEHPFSEHVENSSSELAGSVLIPGDTVLRSLFD